MGDIFWKGGVDIIVEASHIVVISGGGGGGEEGAMHL